MRQDNRVRDAVVVLFVIVAVMVMARVGWSADVIDSSRLADAIKKAENSKTKPYGIMRDYCHAGAEAQCRKGCLQTIEKAKRNLDYKSAEEFIRKFSEIYAPTKGKSLRPAEKKNNKNWPRLVLYFYRLN